MKWFGGFSQTTYPPLTHQWIALFSHIMGLQMAYMFVQLIAILLLPIGMYRYARIWVDEVSASYAALGSVFLGSLGMLVYQSGQMPTPHRSRSDAECSAVLLRAGCALARFQLVAERSGDRLGGRGGPPRDPDCSARCCSPSRCSGSGDSGSRRLP